MGYPSHVLSLSLFLSPIILLHTVVAVRHGIHVHTLLAAVGLSPLRPVSRRWHRHGPARRRRESRGQYLYTGLRHEVGVFYTLC